MINGVLLFALIVILCRFLGVSRPTLPDPLDARVSDAQKGQS